MRSEIPIYKQFIDFAWLNMVMAGLTNFKLIKIMKQFFLIFQIIPNRKVHVDFFVRPTALAEEIIEAFKVGIS